LHNLDEVSKATFNILDPASTSPMALCWEVDDATGILQSVQIMDEHSAWLDFITRARLPVGFTILRKRATELESDASSHDSDAVDSIDQCLSVFGEDVPSL